MQPITESESLTRWVLRFSLVVIILSTFLWGAENHESDVGKRLDASASVLNNVMATPDKAIPVQVLAESQCIVIIPSLVKVALGIGARHGKGVATCRTANGWSAPSPVVFSAGSIGVQIGGKTVDLIMMVMDQSAIERLLARKFKVGANIPGKAGPVGPDASGDTEWKNSEILSYSKSHGVFAGVDLNGASLKQDKDATVELYGRYIPFASILAGKVPPTANSANFLATVRKYTSEASRTREGRLRFRRDSAPTGAFR